MSIAAHRSIDGTALFELVGQVVAQKGFLDVIVHGSSMYPSIADGDAVRLGPVHGAIGAIVLAVVNGQPCLHRIVCHREGQTLIRAESCQREDWVPASSLVSEVREVTRLRPRWWPRLRHRLALIFSAMGAP
jgi:hypothetical protein